MGLRGTEDGPPAEAGAVALATGGTGSVEPSADVVATAEPDDERAV
jgi:hypothetical protein